MISETWTCDVCGDSFQMRLIREGVFKITSELRQHGTKHCAFAWIVLTSTLDALAWVSESIKGE